MPGTTAPSNRKLMQGARASVLEAIGGTPIVRLNHLTRGLAADVYVKLEYLNPGNSNKDRIARTIIDDAEASGELRPGGTIVEATSGNTGMGLALCGAVRGYKCVFVLPDKQSPEKMAALRAFGAKVVVCPTEVAADDPRSYYEVAKRIARETQGAFLANQYFNPSNPKAHYISTGPELWEQTGGELDVFVAGMGTGGTLSGTGKYLREKKPSIKMVGVDPIGSIYYDYWKTGQMIEPRVYKVEGIGEDFLPSTMDLRVLDDVVRVTDAECFRMTRALSRHEGIFTGGSGGAAVAGAIKWAQNTAFRGNIVVLLPDSGSRYMGKIFNDDWLRSHGFMDEEGPRGTVDEIVAGRRGVVTVGPDAKVREVVALMRDKGISQVPVVRRGGGDEELLGIISDVEVLQHMVRSESNPDDTVGQLVKADFAVVDPQTDVATLAQLLAQAKVALVYESKQLVAIVTKIDFIDFMARRAQENT